MFSKKGRCLDASEPRGTQRALKTATCSTNPLPNAPPGRAAQPPPGELHCVYQNRVVHVRSRSANNFRHRLEFIGSPAEGNSAWRLGVDGDEDRQQRLHSLCKVLVSKEPQQASYGAAAVGWIHKSVLLKSL